VWGNILDNGHRREAALLEVMLAAQPDVIILQELMHPATLERFATALEVQAFFAPGNSKRHLGILSRIPIIAATSYRPFPPIRTTILDATLAVLPQHPLHLLGIHLVPHPMLPLELWRWWEIRVLVRYVQRYQRQPCLIAGDFNAIAPGDRAVVHALPNGLKRLVLAQGGHVFHYALAALTAAGFTDCYRALHPQAAGYTLPSTRPNARLDYIFANQALAPALTACEVVTAPPAVQYASDHLPVMAEFALGI
jgi:exonuclease III